jgi:hypothetical protein
MPRYKYYACPSCPVDQDTPGRCDVCGRVLEEREWNPKKRRTVK